MRIRKYEYYACDFETTVYEGQEMTEVWAAACVKLNTEDVKIFHSISEIYDYLTGLNTNVCAYFHNLKFDGSFWMSYLLCDLQYKQAYKLLTPDGSKVKWLAESDMPNNSFKYSISEMGQWYTIIIKHNNKILEIRDSLKLLPFSIKKIGKSFGTKHKKLDMEYKGFRYAGCEITEEEKHYIANDVLVLKEALEIMFQEGHDKLTIGSCCLDEYKKLFGKYNFQELMPNIYEIPLNKKDFGEENAGEYIRKSYRGGWCYLVKGKENHIYRNGTTADVNSLYPSMMSSESRNKFPVGYPKFWKGNYIPKEALEIDKYYFVRVKTRFYIKPGFLPFIQIKHDLAYKGTESLITSDYYDKQTNKYYTTYVDELGEVHDTRVTMTMTMTDFKLFQEHYYLIDFEILDGCYFDSLIGIFDVYINKYKKIKLESTGAIRELAKLFLNNLYGKMATNTDSTFKVAYVKEDKSIGYYCVVEHAKKPGYIPIGSAITSYARNFTITAAQKNFHGIDKPGFIYADTDSIHCDLSPDEITGIKVDDKEFCCWKLESCWDEAIFARQKTYIEHITKENLKPVEKPYYNLKCAGMPDKCKDLFVASMTGKKPDNYDDLLDKEKEFVDVKRELQDFQKGLIIPGKLRPVTIPGGVLLVETTYEMR